jgi:hypothetical protein
MSPTSTEVIQVSIQALLPGITDLTMSEFIEPSILGEAEGRLIESYGITIAGIMRVELSSADFEIKGISPAVQPVNLEFAEETIWRWEIKPVDSTAGQKDLLLKVYAGDEVSEDNLVFVRTLSVEVGEATPPAASPSPLFICSLAALVLAILGLIIYIIYNRRRRRT